MTGGNPARGRLGTGTQWADPFDLLALTSSRPTDALAGARAVLAAAPTPLHASVAHQAIGVVLRDHGDVSKALGELRHALRFARRSGSADRETDVLATLGIALIHAGRSEPGLATLDRAVGRSAGLTAARVRFRRAGALWILGRHGEALGDLRRAIPVLRRDPDPIWPARALTLRGLVHLALGATERADLDFRDAEVLFATTDQELDAVFALHNRGLVAFRSGDLPLALSYLDQSDRRYRALGAPMAELGADRCAVLLAAGLAREALAEADAAVRRVDRMQGQSTRRAELLLMAARAALAAGDPATAVARATTASGLFARQRREWWRAHARLVLLRARFAAGEASGPLLHAASRTATSLHAVKSADAAQAHLLAGRVALALGRPAAGPHLAAAARARFRGPALTRSSGWLAEALRAEAAGQPRRLLGACRRGLDLLDEHRLTLGGSELRAQATAQGAELAMLAQRACLRAGRARELLGWSERWRATTLAVPPVRPPDDADLQADLTAFREISHRLEQLRSLGMPSAAELRREQQRLERDIRARMMRLRGDGRRSGDRLDITALLTELKDHRLVEVVGIDGVLHLLICGDGRVRRIVTGSVAEVATEIEFARATLRRLAYPHDAADQARDLLAATGRRLQELVLGRAVRHLGDGPVVVVPPGRLHGMPWALLPALRERALSVAPSASAWLRARTAAVPDRADVVLVRGPGLRTGGGEVPALAERYPDATVLEHGTATAGRVLAAIDGCRLAHIAAHGVFRADSPMFSALRVDDGPLTVHDIERLRRAPYRLVLSSCDSGRLAAAGADELLGLTAALLPLGTAGIIAGSIPVNDEATVPLMLALHEALRRGASLPEALRDARGALPDDPVQLATGLSFVALGAG